jgi:quercetin dioxygenase-like cupin family protein
VPGEASDGRFALIEFLFPRHASPPPHTHPQDESYVVQEGRLTVQAGEQRFELVPGAVAVVPMGVTPGGTRVVAWIAETDPSRAVRVAVLTPHGVLRGPVTLENGDGFGNVVLSAGRGDRVVAAWHVAVANEWRVRVATYQRGAWSPVATLARSLYTLDHIAVTGPDGTLVRWLERDPRGGHLVRFEARPWRAGWIVATAATPGYGRAVH